jgi:large subunit ribosomal protein L13
MKEEIIIDAAGCVAGRIASFVAKQSLQDKKIIILNCDKAVLIGKKKDILDKYKKKFALGRGSQKGPHFPRVSDKLMRRIVRGMLPWKRTRGREAFRQVHCFIGIPEKFKTQEKKIIAKADAINFLTLHDICRLLGKESKK